VTLLPRFVAAEYLADGGLEAVLPARLHGPTNLFAV
jgi:hypothetical protein